MSSWASQQGSSGSVPELVLLLEEPLVFEAEFLQGAVLSAFRKSLPIGEPDSTEFVTGEFPVFFVQIKRRLLQIKSMPLPYFDADVRPFVNGDPEAILRGLQDPDLKEAVARHKAWISVALMNPDAEPEGKDPYRYPSRMLSAFGFEEIAAILLPAENEIRPWDFEMEDILWRGKGLKLFGCSGPD
jgi:hypothetical protein